MIADAYGMLGGVEWREGNLLDAVRAYQNGRLIEQSDRFGISDSYNLTNSIVVTILIDARQLEPLRPELEAAAATVRAQVEGGRRDQWWAWADYGLLCLLLGNEDEAAHAYDRFDVCGPTVSDYQSVNRVLRSLAEAMTPIDDEAGRRLSEELADLEARAARI